MSGTSELFDVVLLIVAALLPALVYLAWVRAGEVSDKEPWRLLLNAFTYGAIGATVIAAFVELVLIAAGTAISQAYPAPEFVFLNGNSTAGALFAVLVIAPFVEEGFKAWAVTSFGSQMRRVSDGPVIGAGVGLGFGFFENFLYGISGFFVGGLVAGIGIILIRSFSSVLLHGSSTAVFGYGYALKRAGVPGSPAGTHFLAAVGLHSSYNVLASLATIGVLVGLSSGFSTALTIVGFGLAVVMAFGAIEYVRSLVGRSEIAGASPASSRYRPPNRPSAVAARR
jgi:RsiW-degrading membrane proteinase PrsW (M82 family)